MVQVTNHARETISLPVKSGDGSLKAGETRDIDVDTDDVQITSRAHVGLITIGKSEEPLRPTALKPTVSPSPAAPAGDATKS